MKKSSENAYSDDFFSKLDDFFTKYQPNQVHLHHNQ